MANKHGFNTHGVIFDELHTQPNRKLFDVMLQGSGDARMQPLYFLITTAGNDTNSICYEVHQKAIDIAEGRKVDPTFYSVIYGAAENEDWTDPKVWKKANPSLGITVGIDKVRAACESARQNPGEENAFRQLRLNQWVKQSVRWMPMDKWDACAFPVSEDDLEGRICYGGLDLSSTTDITAFVLVFPPLDEEDKYYILPYFWIPEETLDLRVRRDHVPYDLWERQGTLMTTEGNVVHYGYIEKFIEQLGERFNIREIAFDRWGAVQMVQNLEGMGFTVVPFGQGFKDMSPPTKELMKLVLEERIAHGGHPVLRWMMDNIYIRTDPAGNIKADKEKSTEKIDGAIATIMGLDRAIRCGNDTGASVYDSRGFCLSERTVIRYGYLFRAVPFQGQAPGPHRRQRLCVLFRRHHLRQSGDGTFRHADDRRVFLRPHPGRSGGRSAAAPLPLQGGRRQGKALDHPLYLLLHDEPNPEMSSFVFRETLMTHLLLWGNAYAQIIRNGKGEVIALYP